jgi:hypothetical protein
MCAPHAPHAPGSHTHPEPSSSLRPTLTRRGLLAAAGGGLLLAATGGPRLGGAVAAPAKPRAGAVRRSRITSGTALFHADLHNHTLLSDGDGDPAAAFASMRAAGLDVAALTDHATLSDNVLGDALTGALPPEYTQLGGLTPAGWEATGRLADAAYQPGAFTAIRGFEWSEPLLGHVNVWFSRHYTDVLQAMTMTPLHEWLLRDPDTLGGLLDGGADGLAGFNHPGREQGRFEEFRYDARLRDRFVSLEMFNRRDDFLFEGFVDGRPSPLCTCLDNGWRPGLAGVTDEHGTDWGFPEGKGRTGLWLTEHTRAGVREAMASRRFFATRVSGLRLDAVLDLGGRTTRMGGVVPVASGLGRFTVDLARDDSWLGLPLTVQVLRPGGDVPHVVDVVPFTVGEPVTFDVPLDAADGDWVVLRVSDPSQPNATPGPPGHPCNDLAVAYASPWWLEPA